MRIIVVIVLVFGLVGTGMDHFPVNCMSEVFFIFIAAFVIESGIGGSFFCCCFCAKSEELLSERCTTSFEDCR